MVVPEQVQQAVHERRSPRVPDHRRAEDDIPERARHALRQLVPSVEREREDVGLLVETEVLTLELPHLVRAHERDAQLALAHALVLEHAPRKRDGLVLADLEPAAVLDLDRDHRRAPQRLRAVPVSSA